MLNIEVKNGDIQININGNTSDFVPLSTDKKIAEQDISEYVKFIRGTYDIRENLGIPWLEYLNLLNDTDRDNLIISYIYQRVAQYPGIVPSTIDIQLEKKLDRNADFTVTAQYNDEIIILELERSLLNG
jgi:hypothetical protein